MPKISALTAATSLLTTDVLPVVSSGTTKKLTALTLASMNGLVGVTMFGATGNGGTDDTAALQAAVTAAVAGNYILYLNPGTYKITSAITVPGGLTMIGAGKFKSVISLTGNTMSGLVIASLNPVLFESFGITGSATASAGSLLSLDGTISGTNFNQFSTFRDVVFQSGFVQANIIGASTWMMDNCCFFSPTAISLSIANIAHTDAGDQTIMGCVFSGQAGVGTAISHASAGGLKILGCKIIQYANGYTFSMAASVATSDLFITGNSFEAFTGSALTFAKNTGVVFGAVCITGNEISGENIGLNMSPDTGPWCNHMQITGNNIGILSGGTGLVLNGVNDFIIADNTIVQSSPTSGTGITIGVNTSTGKVIDNNIVGFTTPISNSNVGSTIVIERNFGSYNPVGGAAVTPSASPWTLTNGPTTTMYYLSAATSITALTVGGVSILPSATAANVNFPLLLGPNQAAVITYTGAMTAKKNTM